MLQVYRTKAKEDIGTVIDRALQAASIGIAWQHKEASCMLDNFKTQASFKLDRSRLQA